MKAKIKTEKTNCIFDTLPSSMDSLLLEALVANQNSTKMASYVYHNQAYRVTIRVILMYVVSDFVRIIIEST
jgi:hypothetical protein